ncbi:ATP-binding cassette domain-containing protein [Pedococcus sp. P5_B7]
MTGTNRALLEVTDLAVTYSTRGPLRARPTTHVGPVSFQVQAGETFGLVGESGSGKSTIARAVARLQTISNGDIVLAGESIGASRAGEHRGIQMIFQDPDGSLDPRLTALESVQEPLRHGLASRSQRIARAKELLEQVGLADSLHQRYPRQLSGGQKQRVAIARALACAPKLLIADEPVSGLDVLVQAQVLNLLLDLQETEGLTILLISHDLAVVNHMSDHVAVMSHGQIVEAGTADQVVFAPQQPYTKKLLAAVPASNLAATRPDAVQEI